MYLIIFEDGIISAIRECDQDLIDGCDSGAVEIIDISNPSNPLYLVGGDDWADVEVLP